MTVSPRSRDVTPTDSQVGSREWRTETLELVQNLERFGNKKINYFTPIIIMVLIPLKVSNLLYALDKSHYGRYSPESSNNNQSMLNFSKYYKRLYSTRSWSIDYIRFDKSKSSFET